MQLSIIIPLYNVKPYVSRCLRSCLAQDLPQEEYEFVLIDDGSADGSLAKAMEVLSGRGNVKTLSQQNSGQGIARNRGLEMAEGRYVWFVDSDDWIAENILGTLVSRMDSETLDILSMRGADLLADGSFKPRRGFADEGVMTGRSRLASCQVHFGTPFSLYRRKFLMDNGLRFLGGVCHEDGLFTPQAYYLAERVAAFRDPVYFVYPNPTSTTRSENPQRIKDYISVILRKLSDYSKERNCEYCFNDLISSGFSNAMKYCYRMSPEGVRILDTCAYENRDLLAHLRNAKTFKYRVEGYAMSLFPRHMSAVYRFLEHFNPSRPSLIPPASVK